MRIMLLILFIAGLMFANLAGDGFNAWVILLWIDLAIMFIFAAGITKAEIEKAINRQ